MKCRLLPLAAAYALAMACDNSPGQSDVPQVDPTVRAEPDTRATSAEQGLAYPGEPGTSLPELVARIQAFESAIHDVGDPFLLHTARMLASGRLSNADEEAALTYLFVDRNEPLPASVVDALVPHMDAPQPDPRVAQVLANAEVANALPRTLEVLDAALEQKQACRAKGYLIAIKAHVTHGEQLPEPHSSLLDRVQAADLGCDPGLCCNTSDLVWVVEEIGEEILKNESRDSVDTAGVAGESPS